MIISNLAEGGVGRVGEAFRVQARVQKGAGKALGSVIAESDFFYLSSLFTCYN